MVTSTPLQECSSTLPAPAESAFHARERGYSIAVEVTRHLPGPFQSEGLNFSSWRAPQEAPWLAVLSLWPRSNSPWPLLTGWSSLLAFTTKNLTYNTCNNTPHTLPRKCVKWIRLPTNNDLLQQLNVTENPRHQSQVHPLLPSQWIQISVWKFHLNNWHLPSLTAKVTFQILHQKSQDTSSLIWNQQCQKLL